MRVQTSVRRSVLQPISRIRVLGQKSWISAFHCHKEVKPIDQMKSPLAGRSSGIGTFFSAASTVSGRLMSKHKSTASESL